MAKGPAKPHSKTRTAAKRSVAAKKGWHTRRVRYGKSGVSKSKRR